MYTLCVVLLTLVIAWTVFYGVFRLAVYAAEHETDRFSGCGLTASLKDRITDAAVTTSAQGLQDPGDTPAAARRGAAGAAVAGERQMYVFIRRS